MTVPACHQRGVILRWFGWALLVLSVPLLPLFSAAGDTELALVAASQILPLCFLMSGFIVGTEWFSPRHWPHCTLQQSGRWLRVVERRGSRRFGRGRLPLDALSGGLILRSRGTWPAIVEITADNGSKLRIADASDDDDAPWTNRWLREFAIDADHAPVRGLLGLPIPRPFWSGLIALVLSLGALPLLGLLALDGWLRWVIAVLCALLIGTIARWSRRRSTTRPRRWSCGSAW